MGWSWAFWLVQKMHEEVCRQAGLGQPRILVGAWKPQGPQEGPFTLPYCDNIVVGGLVQSEVDAAL
eukprot:12342150-Alexandrium_andersonii.AAC.1